MPEPKVVVPLVVESLPLEVILRPRTGVLNSEEAKEFDWEAYSGLLIAALIVPKTVDDLVDYWKANANILDWSKKVKPDIFEKVRLAFASRRKQLERGDNAGI
jgi:hypothetical protein